MARNGKTRDIELAKPICSQSVKLIAAILVWVVVAWFYSAPATAQSWLKGTWEGTGYQLDADETWSMVLRVHGNRFVIEYPSLKCSGVWRLLDFDSRSARFTEKITTGTTECANSGRVTIERLSRKQIAFRYAYSDTREVSASAILKRRK